MTDFKFCDDHEWSGRSYESCPECQAIYELELGHTFTQENRFMRLAEEAGGARLAENIIQMTKEDLESLVYFVNEGY